MTVVCSVLFMMLVMVTISYAEVCDDEGITCDSRRSIFSIQDPIGKPANILRGISVEAPSEGGNPLVSPSTTNLVTVASQDSIDSPSPLFGPFIQFTFHSNFTSLVQEFYDVIRFKDDSFKAGGVALQPDFSENTNTQTKLANILGVLPEHTTDSGKSFVLARYWKTLHNHTATSVSLNQQYLNELKNIDRNNPDHIIGLFSKYGTHYVSEYAKGDFIYQVFVYESAIFKTIEEDFPNDPNYRWGYRGTSFRSYTKPRVKLPDGAMTGYCSHVGVVLAASGDQALGQINLHDNVYEIQSIVMFMVDYSLAQGTSAMTKTIVSGMVLESFSNEVYQDDENSERAWNEVLKGALFQIFGPASFPGFISVNEQLPLSFYDYFNPDLVTQTATSYATVIQARFKLTDFKVLNPSFVSHLFIFADVIELPAYSRVKLPGTTKIYLICRQFISHSVDSFAPEIVVGNVDSNPELNIIAESFDGVMQVTYATQPRSHVTYVGQSVFRTEKNGNVYDVVSDPSKEIRYPLPSVIPELYMEPNIGDDVSKWLSSSFINGMELSAMTVETVYSLKVSDSTKTAKVTLDWLTATLGTARQQTNINGDLEVVLSRGLFLKKMNPNPKSSWLFVPRLTFSQYQAQYEALLSSVQSYDNTIAEISSQILANSRTEQAVHSQEELNENVLKIGKFLVGRVDTDSQYYKDVANNFNKIVQDKERAVAEQQEKAAMLYKEVLDYSNEVQEAGRELDKEVRLQTSLKIAGIVVDMVLAVGSMFVGGAGITKIGSDIQGIERVAKKIEYVVAISTQIATMSKSIRPLKVEAGRVNKELIGLPDMSQFADYFPTSLDWSDFDADILMYTGGYIGCCEVSAAKFKNIATKLSTRGKAYLEIQKSVSSLQYDIVVNRMHSDIAQKQSDRLNQLKSTLQQSSLTNYEANNMDLFEVGNILQSKANTVRMQLARTYLTMDAALQYDTLTAPTPLSGYDTLSIQSAASQQIINSLRALETVPSPPTDLPNPIVLEIPSVRISDLTSENGFRYTIPLSSQLFFDYIRVRIKEIKVTIDRKSIQSADTDNIFIESNFTGASFRDRDLQRRPKTFNTFSKEYPYVYNYVTGQTITGNRATLDAYAMMTPFGEWIFSIPKVNSANVNVNIQYSGQLTTLKIEFYLNVIFSPPRIAPQLSESNGIGGEFPVSAACGLGAEQSTDCLLQKSHQHTIAGDWDAVMVMSAVRINTLWKQKHDYYDNHGGLAYNITTNWTVTSHTAVSEVEMKITGLVDSPEISFILHNPNTIKMIMTMRNITTSTRVYVYGKKIADYSNKTTSIATITSFNDIGKIQGNVTSMHTVVVNMNSSLTNLDIKGLTGEEKDSLSTALEEQFRKLESRSYDLGTVDFNSKLTPPALQPRQFLFSALGTGTDSKLLICMITGATRTNRTSLPTACDISTIGDTDPVILPTGHTAALYVSSELMFEDIILPDYKNQFKSGAQVEVIPGINPYPAYQISSSLIDLTAYYTIAPCCTGAQHLSTSVSMPGYFKFQGGRNGALEFSKEEEKWTTDVKYAYDYSGRTSCTNPTDTVSAWFTSSCDKQNQANISSNGTITFPAFSIGSITVNHDVETGFFNQHKDEKNQAIRGVADAIKNQIQAIHFRAHSVSVFILTNVIFPEAKVMNTTDVFFTGDLIVLGNVVKHYNPNPVID